MDLINSQLECESLRRQLEYTEKQLKGSNLEKESSNYRYYLALEAMKAQISRDADELLRDPNETVVYDEGHKIYSILPDDKNSDPVSDKYYI